MSKLYFIEKLSQAKRISHSIEGDDIIMLVPTISSYKFKYPDKMMFKNVPFSCEEPMYRLSIDELYDGNFAVFTDHIVTNNGLQKVEILSEFGRLRVESEKGITSNGFLEAKDKVHEYLSSFDEFIFACDTDHTGVRGFDFLFLHYFKIDSLHDFAKNNSIKVKATLSCGWSLCSDSDIPDSLSDTVDFFENNDIANYRKSYLKKDFFDYNYNANSLMLLGKTYSFVFGFYPATIITRNFLRLLFISKREPEKTETVLFSSKRLDVGSPSSLFLMRELLVEMGLIELSNRACEKERMNMTSKGIEFLSLVHRRLDDPGLNKRLDNDIFSDMSISSFKSKYSKYLKDGFSKQKRKMNEYDS